MTLSLDLDILGAPSDDTGLTDSDHLVPGGWVESVPEAEGTGSVPLSGRSVLVSESPITSFDVAITAGFEAGADALTLSEAGRALAVAYRVAWSFDAETGALSFAAPTEGGLDAGVVSVLFREVLFDNSSATPSETQREITFSASDGAQSVSAVAVVEVTDTNATPTLALGSLPGIDEDGEIALGALSVGDTDGHALSLSLSATLDGAPDGSFAFSGDTPEGVSVADSQTGGIVLEGAPEALNAAFDQLVFAPGANSNGEILISASLRETATEEALETSLSAPVALQVAAINDAPVAAEPGDLALVVQEDAADPAGASVAQLFGTAGPGVAAYEAILPLFQDAPVLVDAALNELPSADDLLAEVPPEQRPTLAGADAGPEAAAEVTVLGLMTGASAAALGLGPSASAEEVIAEVHPTWEGTTGQAAAAATAQALRGALDVETPRGNLLTTSYQDLYSGSEGGEEDSVAFLVSLFEGGSGLLSDVDGDPAGVAVTGVEIPAQDGAPVGRLEYKLAGGEWTELAVAEGEALPLGPGDQLRFVPQIANLNTETFPELAPSLSYRAWDGTAGTAGQAAPLPELSQQGAFGLEARTLDIAIASVNDAPGIDLDTGAEKSGTDFARSLSELPGYVLPEGATTTAGYVVPKPAFDAGSDLPGLSDIDGERIARIDIQITTDGETPVDGQIETLDIGLDAFDAAPQLLAGAEAFAEWNAATATLSVLPRGLLGFEQGVPGFPSDVTDFPSSLSDAGVASFNGLVELTFPNGATTFSAEFDGADALLATFVDANGLPVLDSETGAPLDQVLTSGVEVGLPQGAAGVTLFSQTPGAEFLITDLGSDVPEAGLYNVTLDRAQAETLLQSVFYRNASQNPTEYGETPERKVVFTVTDIDPNGDASKTGSAVSTLEITPYDNAPELAFDAAAYEGGEAGGDTIPMTSNESVTLEGLTLSDADSRAGAVRLSPDAGPDGAEAGQFALAEGYTLPAALSFDNSGGELVIAVDTTAEEFDPQRDYIADINEALANTVFTPDVDARFETLEGDAFAVNVAVAVTSDYEDPELGVAADAAASFTIAVAPDLSATDLAPAALAVEEDSQTGVVTLTPEESFASLEFTAIDNGSLYKVDANDEKTGEALTPGTLYALDEADTLRVIFEPDADFNDAAGDGSAGFAARSAFGEGPDAPRGDSVSFTPSVAQVNDAPVLSLNGEADFPDSSVSLEEESPLVFSSANGNAIAVADVDDGESDTDLTVTLSVGQGSLALGGSEGVEVAGDGTGEVTLSGSVSSLNAALDGLTYTPADAFAGNDSLQIDVSDNGLGDPQPRLEGVSLQPGQFVAGQGIVSQTLPDGPASIDLTALDGGDGFEVVDSQIGNTTGFPLDVASAGDVNGDGFNDFVVGGYASDLGRAGVVFGTDSGRPATLDIDSLDGSNGFVLSDALSGRERLGVAVGSAGDLNNDGFDDIVVGNPGADGGGAAYVVFGESDPQARYSRADATGEVGLTFAGSSNTGYGVSTIGDVNGDGVDDLAVASLREIGVIHGWDSAQGAVAPGNLTRDDLDGTNGFLISDGSKDLADFVAAGLEAGDFNGDGRDDILIGASARDVNGTTFVLMGRDGGFDPQVDISLEIDAGRAVQVLDPSSSGGRSSVGDINGDGFDDIVIGDSYAYSNNDSLDRGTAFVVFGGDAFGTSPTIDAAALSSGAGLRITHPEAGYPYGFGYSTASGGDVDGDGFDDILIGTAWNDTSYLVFGDAASAATDELDLATALLEGGAVELTDLESFGLGARHGVEVLDDINGDGIDEIAAANRYNGAGYVVPGATDIGGGGGGGERLALSLAAPLAEAAPASIGLGEGQSISQLRAYDADDAELGAFAELTDLTLPAGTAYVVLEGESAFAVTRFETTGVDVAIPTNISGALTDSESVPLDVAPVADTPTVSAVDVTLDEDAGPATLDVSVSVAETDGTEAITSLSFAGLPAGLDPTTWGFEGTVWDAEAGAAVAASDIALDADGAISSPSGDVQSITGVTKDGDDVSIALSEHDASDLDITVTAGVTDTSGEASDTATGSDTLDVDVTPVADAPEVTGTDASKTIAEDAAATLSGTASLVDRDGSEAITKLSFATEAAIKLGETELTDGATVDVEVTDAEGTTKTVQASVSRTEASAGVAGGYTLEAGAVTDDGGVSLTGADPSLELALEQTGEAKSMALKADADDWGNTSTSLKVTWYNESGDESSPTAFKSWFYFEGDTLEVPSARPEQPSEFNEIASVSVTSSNPFTVNDIVVDGASIVEAAPASWELSFDAADGVADVDLSQFSAGLAEPGASGSFEVTTRATATEGANADAASASGTPSSVTVEAVNDAPVVAEGEGARTLAAVAEDVSDPAGASVSSLVGPAFDDSADGAEANNLAGIHVSGNAASGGDWQYSADGETWTSLSDAAEDAAVFVAADAQLRFAPDADFNGAPGGLTAHLVDGFTDAETTLPATGDTVDLTADGATGGASSVSAGTVSIGTSVTAVNDAPTTDGGPVSVPQAQEDAADPAGATIGALLSDGAFSDAADAAAGAADAAAGVIVTDIPDTTGKGTWMLRKDGVEAPLELGESDAGVFLSADTELRFVPEADWSGDVPALSARVVESGHGFEPGQSFATLPETGGASRVSAETLSVDGSIAAVADAPDLSVTATASGVEDKAIALDVSAATTDLDGSETLSVVISGAPEGAVFSDGETTVTAGDGGEADVSELDLAKLTVTPPADSDADLDLTATATATDGADAAERSETISATVRAAADAPTLSAENADKTLSPQEDAWQALGGLSAELSDTDGSESLTVTLSGLPEGAALRDGTNSVTIGADGEADVTGWSLDAIEVQAPEHSDAAFDATVTAEAAESASGDQLETATASQSATITIDPVAAADAPELTTSAASGDEDAAIALDVTPALVDSDGSEMLSLEIAGAPAGAVLSDGGANSATSDGSAIDVSEWDLSGLQVTPPEDSDADFDLTVTATATEAANADAAETVRTLSVSVSPVADAPSLSVAETSISADEGAQASIPVATSLSDADGSEAIVALRFEAPADASLHFDGTRLAEGDAVDVPVKDGGTATGTVSFEGSVTVVSFAAASAASAIDTDRFSVGLSDPDASGDFEVTVSALTQEGDDASLQAESALQTVSVSIEAVNDAPEIAGPDTVSASEDTAFAFMGADALSVSDVDLGDADPAATLQVELEAVNGTLSVDDALAGQFTDADGSDGTLSFSGSETEANAILASLEYTGGTDFNTDRPASSETLTVRVDDNGASGRDDAGGETAVSREIGIAVAAVNDAPEATAEAESQTLSEDGSLTFSVAQGNALSVSDVDLTEADPEATLSASLTVSLGVLEASAAGAAVVTGAGTDTLTVEGAPGDIDATLDGLVYRPGADRNGSDTLTLEASDGAATGKVEVDLTIEPENDAPVAVADSASLDATPEDALLDDDPDNDPGSQTVGNLFADAFDDAADELEGGSSADPLGGVAIVTDGADAQEGRWTYQLPGSTEWVALPGVSQGEAFTLSAEAKLRFEPAVNFNDGSEAADGHALSAHLVEGPVTDEARLDLSLAEATGGTSTVSSQSVELDAPVTAVDDQYYFTASVDAETGLVAPVLDISQGEAVPGMVDDQGQPTNELGGTIDMSNFAFGEETDLFVFDLDALGYDDLPPEGDSFDSTGVDGSTLYLAEFLGQGRFDNVDENSMLSVISFGFEGDDIADEVDFQNSGQFRRSDIDDPLITLALNVATGEGALIYDPSRKSYVFDGDNSAMTLARFEGLTNDKLDLFGLGDFDFQNSWLGV